MVTVAVSFTALPEHVRTARFVAASVARRAGIANGLLDEIRLAVSEACSLAVRQHQAFAPAIPVELRLIEGLESFSIQVADAVARGAPDQSADNLLDLGAGRDGEPAALVSQLSGPEDEGAVGVLEARERIGLAVISGLVDDVEVDYGATGAVVTMTWPLAPHGADIAGQSGNTPSWVR